MTMQNAPTQLQTLLARARREVLFVVRNPGDEPVAVPPSSAWHLFGKPRAIAPREEHGVGHLEKRTHGETYERLLAQGALELVRAPDGRRAKATKKRRSKGASK